MFTIETLALSGNLKEFFCSRVLEKMEFYFNYGILQKAVHSVTEMLSILYEILPIASLLLCDELLTQRIYVGKQIKKNYLIYLIWYFLKK